MRYRLLGPLGRGGMGEVFLAEDSELARKVALKFLPEALRTDASALRRLRREAKSAAALDHPYICKVYDVGESEDGRTFIAMEFIDGETLADRLSKGPLADTEALRLAVEIAEAIAKAHAHGIVHRDLKPGNVMLGVDRHAKVMDFGLAKALRQETGLDSDSEADTREAVTRDGVLVGTPAYMSPEQLRGDDVDAASDWFAFGILLSVLFTGRHPFARDSPAETIAAILKEAPVGLDALPDGIRSLVERLLAKDANDRPDALAELRRLAARGSDLERHVPAIRPLIGRDEEQALVRKLMSSLRGGHGGLVLIGGEPGVGKTRLASETLAAAERLGFLALRGHCYEMEGAAPFTPWVESFDLAARLVDRQRFRQALGDAAAEVAKLLPSLRRDFDDIPEASELPPEQQRRYLFQSIRETVGRLAADRPIVWLLDDLHWADESSLLLLSEFASRLESVPVLFLGTYRDVELEVGKPFERALAQLVRQRQAHRLPLKRLNETAVAELLTRLAGEAPPTELTRRIYEETEGNPFFVEEVFEHLREEDKLFDAKGRWRADAQTEALDVPEGVRLVLGRRLERLSEGTPEVLTAAAAIGRVFDVRVLEMLDGLDEEAVLDALEEAEAAQLVEPASSSRETRYQFHHELVKHTLLASVSLRRRQRLHLRIARSMESVFGEQEEEHAAELAHHYYEAGAAAEPETTLRYLQLAGERALATAASSEAVRFFTAALSLDELTDERTRAELLMHRGKAHYLDHWERPLEDWHVALAIYEELGDGDAVGELCAQISYIQWLLAAYDEAVATARRGTAVLDPAPSPARCRLLAAEGMALALANETDAGEARLQEALEMSLALGDPKLRGDVLRYRQVQCLATVRFREVVEAGEAAIQVLREAGDDWGVEDTASWADAGLVAMGRLKEAHALAAKATPPGVQRRNLVATANRMLSDAVKVSMESASLDALADLWRRYVAYCDDTGFPWHYLGTIGLGRVAFWRGDIDEAVGMLDPTPDVEPPGRWFGLCGAALFFVKAYRGDDDALPFLRGYVDLEEFTRERSPGSWWSSALIAEALAVLDESEPLEHLKPLFLDAIRANQAVTVLCGPQLYRKVAAICDAANRRWESAIGHFEEALRQADTLPHKLEQPEVRRWYAKMLLDRGEAGDRDRARKLLTQAVAQYRDIGMPFHLEMAHALLEH